jgi:hypothetical protein
MDSLGREPQDTEGKREKAAERRQNHRGDACRSRHNAHLPPPSGAFLLLSVRFLGLTPQAMDLSPLRGSHSNDNS